jgi:hypothetical protein
MPKSEDELREERDKATRDLDESARNLVAEVGRRKIDVTSDDIRKALSNFQKLTRGGHDAEAMREELLKAQDKLDELKSSLCRYRKYLNLVRGVDLGDETPEVDDMLARVGSSIGDVRERITSILDEMKVSYDLKFRVARAWGSLDWKAVLVDVRIRDKDYSEVLDVWGDVSDKFVVGLDKKLAKMIYIRMDTAPEETALSSKTPVLGESAAEGRGSVAMEFPPDVGSDERRRKMLRRKSKRKPVYRVCRDLMMLGFLASTDAGHLKISARDFFRVQKEVCQQCRFEKKCFEPYEKWSPPKKRMFNELVKSRMED